MGYYTYSGRNRRGELVTGVQRAPSKTDATHKLRSKGIAVREIKEKSGILYKDLDIGRRSIPYKDLVIYIRQFSTLIKAGITILDATSILKQQTSQKRLKSVLVEIEEDLKAGHPFSVAAEQHPHVFPLLFTNMLKAGEAGGQFDDILDNMANYFEKQHETRQKVKSAMLYPMVLAFVAIAVSLFMIGFILPRFASMFTQLGADVPFITLWMLNLGEFIQKYWWILLVICGILFLLFKVISGRDPYRYYLHSVYLNVPVFGPILTKAILARTTRTLSSLYSASVPMTTSLSIVGKVVGNAVIEDLLVKASNSIQQGDSLAKPMIGHWAIPPFVSQMMVLGEKSGTLDFMLSKVADFYEREVDQSAERMKSLLEPILILIIAVVVGGVVVSIMIPMFSIFTEIQ
ncbi:type II secretion system F family protein [Chungangia koreensis]|uniref:Type II secretion system F family protein n=1 Tax=Chungangia koreensis TaxID=752657 RepID=A0ABV8X4B9_9LACT